MIEVRKLTRDERDEILTLIEDYHAIFYTFVGISDVKFSNRYPTAWVEFTRGSSKPGLFLNEEFWNKLNDRERAFVICHECLHVFLDHGVRRGEYLDGANSTYINQAQDITINEMIESLFKINRNELTDWKNFCWIETCFPKIHPTVERNREFYYYLELLIKHGGDVPKNISLVDQHGTGADSAGSGNDKTGSGSGSNPEDGSGFDEEKLKAAKRLGEELNVEELEAILGAMGREAGTGAGALERLIADQLKPKRLNIEKLIERLKATRYKYGESDAESFRQVDRRLSQVSRDLVIPGTVTSERPEKTKLLTAFFMDVSGSCMEFFETFERIVASFRAEDQVFELRTYAFDTSVQEIQPGTRLRVGGGTAFNIIEQKLLDLEEEHQKYPDCVIVLTDGYGNRVTPKFSKRWIWLMTDGHSTAYVPAGARVFLAREVVID